MDFPIFHLDFLNNRILIAVVAITHVVINHGMAVGGIPFVVWLERKGIKTADPFWTDLARRLMTVFFIVTTTLGALSGVGIWFTTTLVNPAAIGSLLRVFFWTWAVEWGVFISEVALIMWYQLSWKRMAVEKPRAHLRLGVALAVASWLTMTLIVAILAFMMDTGSWGTKRTLFSGMANPLYLPQLAFRTPFAMVLAGALSLPVVSYLTRATPERRREATRATCLWLLVWLGPCLLGAWWYANRVPEEMARNIPVALLTMSLSKWASAALKVAAGAVGLTALVALWGVTSRRGLRILVAVIPAVACVWLLGHIERVREFVRKPFAISDYLYANGVRKADYPLFERDGILAHTAHLTRLEGHSSAPEAKGKQVFLVACSRCHTVDGVNGIRGTLSRMYGASPWDAETIDGYMAGMHRVRPFMPPFPGSNDERRALSQYLVSLRVRPDPAQGAQVMGIHGQEQEEGLAEDEQGARVIPEVASATLKEEE